MKRWLIGLMLACAACGGTASDGAHGGAAGMGSAMTASCKPSPARCDAFTEERPLPLSEHAAVYDQERAELVVFGGTDSVPASCMIGGPTRYLFNTFIYDDACGKWLRVTGQSPSPSGRHMAAFGDGSMWVFGGRFRDAKQASGPYQIYDDLTRFDVAARTWHSVDVAGTRPAPRASGVLAWDNKRRELWLFGGNLSADGAAYAPSADVWTFDPKERAWTEQHSMSPAPAARLFHAALYDDMRDTLIVYGGADASALSATAKDFGDLWALSLSDLRWERLHPGGLGAPEGRFWAGLTLDATTHTYLLFGGHDDQMLGNRNDTWRFDPDARSWQRIEEGDSYNKPAAGVCMFPPDFANIDPTLPERRSAHTLLWSNACKHALLFAGKTDCGAIDDVWSFDGDRWQKRLSATAGEVCLRSAADAMQCSALCM